MTDAPNERIRVTATTKERLDRRKHPGESYDDAIERLLSEGRDLLAGFGAAERRQGDTMAETVTRRKEGSSERIQNMDEGES